MRSKMRSACLNYTGELASENAISGGAVDECERSQRELQRQIAGEGNAGKRRVGATWSRVGHPAHVQPWDSGHGELSWWTLRLSFPSFLESRSRLRLGAVRRTSLSAQSRIRSRSFSRYPKPCLRSSRLSPSFIAESTFIRSVEGSCRGNESSMARKAGQRT